MKAGPKSAAAPAARKVTKTISRFTTKERFADLGLLPQTARAIAEVLGYEFMSQVQAATYGPITAGEDVLAKAKTGTGKTLGFLIPSIEKMCRADRVAKAAPGRCNISILIISPTRELTLQIAKEATFLTTYLHVGIITVVGGTNISADKRKLAAGSGVDVLVGTPGRLLDHLKNTPGVAAQMGALQTLILDEADQMLEMGFRPDIERIISFLPKQRQTLLFSATVTKDLQRVTHIAMKSNHKFLNTVPESEANTHLHVPQTAVVVPFQHHVGVLYDLLEAAVTIPDYKVLVFFPTARHTQFMADLMEAAGFSILQIHSRKSQSYRTKVSKQFHDGVNLIMFSSDVSARGLDYPDITFVLQVGSTDRESYIHRVGRTARAGKAGRALLLLCEFEEYVLQSLKDLPLQRFEIQTEQSRPALEAALASVERNGELKKTAVMAYQAWLGYYNSNRRALRWSNQELVQMAVQFSKLCGLREQPALQKKTVGKMGLKGTPGLRVM
jgi:ATP-dependent RNA helicase MSS116